MECLSVPEGPLTAGSTIQICYGPIDGKPNQTITVTITNDTTDQDTVDIELDPQGYGCADWVVANWDVANFACGDCDDVFRPIT